MNRPYAEPNKKKVEFFVGTEIEHSPAFGHRTLFVVGAHTVEKIVGLAQSEGCTHIYLGANQSFDPLTWRLGDEATWEHMCEALVENHKFLITLDFEPLHLSWVHNLSVADNPLFIPMISLRLPSIQKLNPNATLKLDDTGFAATNEGVWCTNLKQLQKSSGFTSWQQYSQDKIL